MTFKEYDNLVVLASTINSNKIDFIGVRSDPFNHLIIFKYRTEECESSAIFLSLDEAEEKGIDWANEHIQRSLEGFLSQT